MIKRATKQERQQQHVMRQLYCALVDCRYALVNWMEIADPEDERKADHLAVVAADKALAAADEEIKNRKP